MAVWIEPIKHKRAVTATHNEKSPVCDFLHCSNKSRITKALDCYVKMIWGENEVCNAVGKAMQIWALHWCSGKCRQRWRRPGSEWAAVAYSTRTLLNPCIHSHSTHAPLLSFHPYCIWQGQNKPFIYLRLIEIHTFPYEWEIKSRRDVSKHELATFSALWLT